MPLDDAFWNKEGEYLWSALVDVFVSTLMDGVQGGVEALPPEIQILMDFDVVNQAAVEYAREYRYNTIVGIIETKRKQVQTLIGNWIESGDPLNVLEAQLQPIFGSVSAEMIASTEVTRVFANANQQAWRATGFVGGKVWRTADDRVCPVCGPLHNQEVGLNNGFYSVIGGGFPSPPAHPRCRCWLQPIVSVDLVMQDIDRILNDENIR